MDEPTMDRAALLSWATLHAGGRVVSTPDYGMSLSSKLLRFRWNDAPTVAVGAAPSVGKTRINAVLDAMAMVLAEPTAASTVNLILGLGPDEPQLKEHLGAISTLVAGVTDGPEVKVWTLTAGQDPVEVSTSPPQFTTGTPQRWAKLLTAAAQAPVEGMAATIVGALAGRPSFALYPKLTSLASSRPWQMRLDGLEIGRAGRTSATLQLASNDLTRPNEPRTTWLKTVGPVPRTFAADEVDDLIVLVDSLIASWTHPSQPTAVLAHGQAEHALEAHILSARTALRTESGPLRLAVPFRSGTLGAAQFPTLWGDVTRPARYLDALLADDSSRPWAVELKDQDAGGGHGAYLRHGIGQAVLYRHYIRSASQLDEWFSSYGLQRTQCQAALAFPTASPGASATVTRLRDLAKLFDVEVIEFPRPGS